MENLDNRITPSDDNNSLNNLGKRRDTFVPIEDVPSDVPNDESELYFGMPPDKFLMLKDEALLKEEEEFKKKTGQENESETSGDHDETTEPSQTGGGVGTKALKWFEKFKL